MRKYTHKSYGRTITLETPKLSDFESHPIAISFRLISTKYSNHQWEVEIQLNAQIFGQKGGNPLMAGHTYVSDMDGNLSPFKAFNQAVQQIMKGDKHWRPILCHDQER